MHAYHFSTSILGFRLVLASMSLASAFESELSASMPHMHQNRLSNQIRAPIVGNAYNQMTHTLSPSTGVHVSVEGVPFQYQLTDDDLMKVFSRYGQVSGITVLDEGGAAVVQFTNPTDAAKATAALDGKVLNGVHGALRVTLFPGVPVGHLNAHTLPFDRQMNRKFTCRFEVSSGIDRDFQISKRIIGQKGINMKKIVSSLPSVDAAKLRLRGRGSGFLEGPLKQESNETLHLCVSCRDAETYSIVLREVTALLEEVYAQYADWCKERGLQHTIPKVIPRDHPADSYVPGTFASQSYTDGFGNGNLKSLYPPSWNDWKNPRGCDYGQTPSPYSTHPGPSTTNTPPELGSPSQRCPLDVGAIERLIEERNEARRVCNFKEADRLRDLLKAHGIGLMDEPGARGKGCQVTTWRFGVRK